MKRKNKRCVHFRVVPFAVTHAGTVRPVPTLGTDPLPTICTLPPVRAGAAPVGRITDALVLAPARLGTVDAVLIVRAGVETLGAHKPGRTDALARHPVAVGAVEAFAPLRALQPVPAGLAAVGAHHAGETGRTNTLTRHWIARSAVLAAALRLTLGPVRTGRARFGAAKKSKKARQDRLMR